MCADSAHLVTNTVYSGNGCGLDGQGGGHRLPAWSLGSPGSTLLHVRVRLTEPAGSLGGGHRPPACAHTISRNYFKWVISLLRLESTGSSLTAIGPFKALVLYKPLVNLLRFSSNFTYQHQGGTDRQSTVRDRFHASLKLLLQALR